MTACSAAAPTITSRVIENSLHVGSEFAEQMDPMELSSLNELLECIAALGVATDAAKQEKFLKGLNDELSMQLMVATFNNYQELVDRALMIEGKQQQIDTARGSVE